MPKPKRYAFNDTQIKDGWIVKMRKDGTIKSRIERYFVVHKNQLKPKSER
jgi:ABC-type amino acid transport substrate-binding protein